MKQATKLIINSGTMIMRMVLTVGIGLVATRLLLQWLGEVDFGLMSALGATGVLLQSVTMALTTSAQRHFAYEIGREDEDKLIRAFNTAWVIMIGMSAILWLIGQLAAPAIMYFLLQTEEAVNRSTAAWWVYQISLITLVVTVASTPYRAMLVATQRLPIIAAQSVLFSVLRFGAILLLLVVPGDLLISFVVMQLIAFTATQGMVVTYCMWHVSASRPRPRKFDRSEVGRFVHFAGWSTLGNLSMRMRMQGGMLLLTSFFGPAINSAYTVAAQVATYSSNLTNSMKLAIQPVIVGAEAKGNKQTVHRLALVGGKYTLFLLSFVFIPFWLEAPLLLDIWLKEVPAWTLVLVRMVMIWMMMHVFFMGYSLALQATGNIGWYTRIILALSTAILVASGIAFALGAPPWALPAFTILSMVVRMLVSVIGIGREIDLAPSKWVRQTLIPSVMALVPALAIAVLTHILLDEGWVRLMLVVGAYLLTIVPLIWFVGMADWERNQFAKFAGKALSRFRRKKTV